ncbi:MAG: hypothetical protein Q8P61_08900 [Candidatus Nanopelagicales bacterium]|nr:hypothetical protein [Candidatus Nanopelagicales bacterium]
MELNIWGKIFAATIACGCALVGLGACSSGSVPPAPPPPATSASASEATSLDGTSYDGHNGVLHTDNAFLTKLSPTTEPGTSSAPPVTHAELTIPSAGTSITITPSVPAPEEVVSADFAFISDTPQPAVAALVLTHRDAEGLQPEEAGFLLQTFNEDGTVKTSTPTELTPEDAGPGDQEYSLLGATAIAAVVIVGDIDYLGEGFSGYSLTTGKKLWTSKLYLAGASGSIAVGWTDVEPNGGRCDTVTGLNINTGQAVWAKADRDIMQRGQGSWHTSSGFKDGCPTFLDTRVINSDPGLLYLTNGGTLGGHGNNRILREDSGNPVGDVATNIYSDPVAHLVTAAGISGPGSPYASHPYGMTVTDAITGKNIYTVSDEQGAKLQLEVHGVADGKIWATTTDQNIIIDARTGTTVDTGWDTYPVVSGAGWYLEGENRGSQADQQFGELTLVMTAENPIGPADTSTPAG